MIILGEDSPRRTIKSLNLSLNEHLTPKCFQALHYFDSLQHLTLEKCNIGDDILKLLLNLDPFEVRKAENIESASNITPSAMKLRKSTISFDGADPPEEPPGIAFLSQGFKHGPKAQFWFAEPIANSSQLDLPRQTAPDAATRSTTVASKGLI